jgi:hypothetical protein
VRAYSLLLSVLPFQAGPSERVRDGWREDLRFLYRELERVHPRLFHAHPREEWERYVKALEAEIPKLDEAGFVVGMLRLVKLAEDGHTTLLPNGAEALARCWPVAFWCMADGTWVRAAAPEYQAAVGGRVVAWAGVPVAQVVDRFRTVTSGDDPKGGRWLLERLLSFPALHRTLGIGAAGAPIVLTIARADGARVEIPLAEPEPGPPAVFRPKPSSWVDAGPKELPLWLRDPDRPYWYTHLKDDGAMYLRYRQVLPDRERPFPEFCEDLFRAVERAGVDRLVVDLRDNNGGNSGLLQPLIHGLIRSTRISQPGHLFVLTNGVTFSAAVSCAGRIERETPALFVGEPTAAGPNHFGDAVEITLPKTGWLVRVSSLHWQESDPRDRRRWIAPDLPAPMTMADYAAGRDPVLAAALAFNSESPGSRPARLTDRWRRQSQAGAVGR